MNCLPGGPQAADLDGFLGRDAWIGELEAYARKGSLSVRSSRPGSAPTTRGSACRSSDRTDRSGISRVALRSMACGSSDCCGCGCGGRPSSSAQRTTARTSWTRSDAHLVQRTRCGLRAGRGVWCICARDHRDVIKPTSAQLEMARHPGIPRRRCHRVDRALGRFRRVSDRPDGL